MEYIEGETLATRIRKGPLSLDGALKIAIEVAGALDAAHRKSPCNQEPGVPGVERLS